MIKKVLNIIVILLTITVIVAGGIGLIMFLNIDNTLIEPVLSIIVIYVVLKAYIDRIKNEE